MADRIDHEWDDFGDGVLACKHCDQMEEHNISECPAKLRAALNAATRDRDDLLLALEQTRSDMSADLYAATRERDEALARPTYTLERGIELARACQEDGERLEREAVVRWLRSPKRGPGLILSMYADAIERGEHTKEQT